MTQPAASPEQLLEISALRDELAGLRGEVQRLRDEADIRRLQYEYGYYDDYRDWDRLLALFADDCWVEIGTRGRYEGKARVERFFREIIGQNRTNLGRGEIYNHLQLQMIVTVAPDGQSAKARSRALIQGAPGGGPAMVWAEGVYENSFVKSESRWWIQGMYWAPTFYAKVSGIDELSFAGAPASEAFPPDRTTAEPDEASGRHLVGYHF